MFWIIQQDRKTALLSFEKHCPVSAVDREKWVHGKFDNAALFSSEDDHLVSTIAAEGHVKEMKAPSEK